MKKKNKILIVGAGITGITLAERFASAGDKVLLLEERDHIGGNCYDFYESSGILVHKYGPHIFHTNNREVWNYLSRFTEWREYKHRVLGFIDGEYVPIPFNLNSLHILFPLNKAKYLERELINIFGLGNKVSILDLKKNKRADLKELADYIYQKVFLNYNKKQWGLRPEETDPEVSGRVPVFISRDEGYFQDKYQGIPKEGYAKMFERMISAGDIEMALNKKFNSSVALVGFDKIFYTGPIDEFFNNKFGKLGWRAIKIKFKTYNRESYQTAAVVNYPNDHKFTRIAEFKKLTGQISDKTIAGFEYPGNKGFLAYPVLSDTNKKIYADYQREAATFADKRIYFAGRLAEYKYYDMDDAVGNALNMHAKIIS